MFATFYSPMPKYGAFFDIAYLTSFSFLNIFYSTEHFVLVYLQCNEGYKIIEQISILIKFKIKTYDNMFPFDVKLAFKRYHIPYIGNIFTIKYKVYT